VSLAVDVLSISTGVERAIYTQVCIPILLLTMLLYPRDNYNTGTVRFAGMQANPWSRRMITNDLITGHDELSYVETVPPVLYHAATLKPSERSSALASK